MFKLKQVLPLLCGLPIFIYGCQGGAPEESNAQETAPTKVAEMTVPGETPKADDSKPAEATPAGISFADIKPILDKECANCHRPPKPQDGVDVTTYEAVMKGGVNGPMVVPGDPEKSQLVMVLRGTGGMNIMPPAPPPLPEETIKKIEAWIAAGAKE